MKVILISILLLWMCTPKSSSSIEPMIPSYIIGTFEDDYEIKYQITDSTFRMNEQTIIHIKEWNLQESYFVGQNDSLNIYDPLLYSRIDWIKLEKMLPYSWAFCMSYYNSISLDSTKVDPIVDRTQPKSGCNGHPFSRMKPILN